MCDKTELQGEASATHGLSSAESAVHERLVMLPCPFCGAVPYHQTAEDVIGTCCEIECDCGMARASVQICDLMTREERSGADFVDYMYPLKYRERALEHCIKQWNTRAI